MLKIILLLAVLLYPENTYYQPASSNIIFHAAYCLEYAEPHEQASWVSYMVTKECLSGPRFRRSNDYRVDPAIPTVSAHSSDYKRSGYDRGHLAPIAVFAYSAQTMSESFFMSNISPQRRGFRKGIWKRLEKTVRSCAKQDDTLYVTTGPVLKGKLRKIGRKNKVSVPKRYYKVILDYTGPLYKAIGFLVPNKASNLPMVYYAVPVDSVESVTGLDFFPGLPDSIENKIEAGMVPAAWLP